MKARVIRRVSKHGAGLNGGVTTDVVWYAVKRYAKRIGIAEPNIDQILTPVRHRYRSQSSGFAK